MDMTRYYYILSYGCQMNQSDSEHYAGQLEELGYAATEDIQKLMSFYSIRAVSAKRLKGRRSVKLVN